VITLREKLTNIGMALIFVTSLLLGLASLVQASGETVSSSKTERAVFAGGCFWCMEGPFDKLPGVISTRSGYTAGHVKNPSYRQVSAGRTGHTEAVEIVFDPNRVSFDQLLKVFWKNIDPLDAKGQFCDKGSQYRAGIFYQNESQQASAESSLAMLKNSRRFQKPIVTEITRGSVFYPAEDYHQDYYLKNPVRYKYYRFSCGRDKRLEALWSE